MKQTILAVPSGSLQTKTLALLAKTGIISNTDTGRKYEIPTEYPGLILRILDRRDMPQCILDSMADFGLTGMDYLIESGLDSEMEMLGELNFARATDGPSRFVLAGPREYSAMPIDAVKGRPIYTELPLLTEIKLRERGFEGGEIIIRKTNGKTETRGKFQRHVIADTTETGATLEKNDLFIIAELFQSRPTFFAPGGKSNELMKEVVYLFTKTLEQEQNPKVMIEMNVPRASLEQVKSILSAQTSPTIMATDDIGWVVVKVLVPRTEFITKIGLLRALGVTGIAEIEITSVL